MGRYRRKKMHQGDRPLKEKYRTKRRTRDMDQIHEDMQNPKPFLNQEVDLDKPGAAQHYCIHCAKHFVSERALTDHFRGKPHKRRMKALETEPFTHEESDRAAGFGSYIAPKKFTVKTLRRADVEKDGDGKVEEIKPA